MARTVLIVEDEPDLAGLLSDVLQSVGYDVVLTTGSRAAARSVEITPAAIVLDYLMPGMNGAEVVDQIRAAMPAGAPPIILVTGLSNAKELASTVRAEAYLRKPFDVDSFLRLVDQLAKENRKCPDTGPTC
jgi:two-component system OmpR family response regulator